MIYHLKVQVEAIFDAKDAFEWYELQKEGLGFGFLNELEKGFEKITTNPQHFSTYINKLYRRIRIHRFPFLVLYEIEENNVIVIGIRHTKRDIKK